MSAIPVHLERRFEQKWVARFGPATSCRKRIEDRCGESHASNADGSTRRAAKAAKEKPAGVKPASLQINFSPP
jgi:hypothetical protein